MTAGSWSRRYFANSLALLVTFLLSPAMGSADDFVFGPVTCQRGTGAPTVFNYTFAASEPSRGYFFKVYNGGLEDTTYELVSSSMITLNGVEILGPSNFNQNVPYLEVPVTLQAQNSLSVEVRGKPGGAIILKLFPFVVIDTPAENQVFNTQPVSVSGHLNSPATSVSINGLSATVSGTSFSLSGVSLAEGRSTVTATATRADGFMGSDSAETILDSLAPVIALTHPSEGFLTNQNITPQFSVSDAQDANPTVTVSPAPPYATEGAQQMTITAKDWAGNEAQASRIFTIDKTPPAVSSLLPAPGTLLPEATPVISAAWSDALSGLDIASSRLLLDGTAVSAQVGAAGISYQPPVGLPGGAHQVSLAIKDRAGNEAAASWSFSVSSTPPEITVISPAEGLVTNQAVTLNYSVMDDLDPHPTVTVTPPPPYDAEGAYHVVITATDLAGNQSQVSRDFVIDKTPPVVGNLQPANGAILAGVQSGGPEPPMGGGPPPSGGAPGGTGIVISATFADVRSGINPSRTSLTFDGMNVTGAAQAVASSIHYQLSGAVPGGSHHVRLIVFDGAGNPAEIAWTFVVDATAPTVTVVFPSRGAALNSDVLAPNVMVTDDFDPTPIVAFLPPPPYVSEGLHSALVVATDQVGNKGYGNLYFTIDKTAPTIAFFYPAEGQRISSVVAPDYAVIDNLDPHPMASIAPPPPYEADGNYQVLLTATDWAGNQAQMARSFTLDRTAPTISDLTPAPGAVTNEPQVQMSASFSDALTGIDVAAVRLAVDGVDVTADATIVEQGFSYVSTGPPGDGIHQVRVVVRDQVGNESTAEWTFTLDSIPPVITVLSPANGAVTNQDVVLSYTAEDNVDPSPMVTLEPAPPFSAEGAYHVVITAQDHAGNQLQTSVNFTIDKTPPTISFNHPSEGQLVKSANELGYTVADALDQHPIVNLVPPPPYAVDGNYQVVLTATDWAGNQTQVIRNFVLDQTPPAIGTLSPATGAAIASSQVQISASFADALAGIAATAVWLAVDGTDVTSSATVTEQSISYLPATPLADGGHQVALTVRDRAENEAVAQWSFSVDTVPPTISILTPADGASVSSGTVDLAGSVDDAQASVTVNGTAVVLAGRDFTFAGIPIAIGPNSIVVEARDVLGNRSSTILTISYLPPSPSVSMSAAPSSIVQGETAVLSWVSTNATTASFDQGLGEVGLSGSVNISPAVSTTYTITVTGDGGTASASASVTVRPGILQATISASSTTIAQGETTTLYWNTNAADRVIIEPGVGEVGAAGFVAVSPASTTTYRLTAIGPTGISVATVLISVLGTVAPIPGGQFAKQYEDLIPADATIAAYDEKRFALVTGKVFGHAGLPIDNVRVSVKERTDLGSAATRADGTYSLPVEGGGAVILSFEHEGYLPVQRRVDVEWNDIAVVESVVLLPEDPEVTKVVLDGNPASVFVHRGSVTTDEFGSRAATLAITGDTQVYAVTKVGEVELSSFELRATEYATPETMPALLPPESIYTYCVNVRASGLEKVRFSKPASLLVDNFFGLPVGTVVPVGYYDFELSRWVASDNGKVVALLDTDGNGVTDALDATGDGLADDLNGNGSVGDEAGGLTDPVHYAPGSTFWRATISHLTPYDLNFPWVWVIPEDNPSPNPGGPPDGDPPRDGGPGGQGCGEGSDPQAPLNSYAESQGRIFHDDVGLPEVDYGLHYASDRVPGYRATITVPASGSTVPPTLEEIEVRVTVAGRIFEKKLPPEPNQIVSFAWDGLDYLGREVTTDITASVEVEFTYPAYIANASSSAARAFGLSGGTALFSFARMKGTVPKTTTIKIHRNLPVSDLGQGWDLSIHHTMSPANPTVVYKGDGSILRQDLRSLQTFAGGDWYGCVPAGMAVDGAGNVFVSDCWHRVLKIDRLGQVSTYAGRREDPSWGGGFAGDGGPAASARLKGPGRLAVDSMGNLYIDDSGNRRIRKVDTSGTITTVVGNGQRWSSPDGTTALAASIMEMTWSGAMAADGLGNLYFVDSQQGTIRKVGTDGLLATVLRSAYPYQAVAVDRAGNVYAAYYGAVQRLSPDGRVRTVAGGGYNTLKDGIPALGASLYGVHNIIANSDGSLYLQVSTQGTDAVYRVDPAGVLHAVPHPWGQQAMAVDPEGSLYLASFDSRSGYVYKLTLPARDKSFNGPGEFLFAEGGLGYLFAASGQHKATIDLASRVSLYTFGYADDRLVSVTDRFGKTTTIQRNGSGEPTAIVLPSGRQVSLAVSGGRMQQLTYPDNTAYSFSTDTSGLLREKWDPNGNHFTYQYDASGRLESAADPEGGQANWLRWKDPSGRTFTEISRAEGGRNFFEEKTNWDGSYTSTMTGADGSTRTYTRSANGWTETIASGCGTTRTRSFGLAPVWNFKYLREVTDKTPAGLTRKHTVTPTYQDTNGDQRVDRFMDTVTVNNKVTVSVNDILTGTRTSTSPAGRVVTSTYDPLTLLAEQVSVAGLLPTSFQYDARGNLRESIVGARATLLSYDDADRPRQMTTADGRIYEYSYDEQGRLLTEARPDGGVVEYDYDANGNIKTLLTPNLVAYGFDFTANNQRRNFVQPLSGSYAYWYDRERRVQRVVAPSGREVVNTYAEGNLATTTSPEGTTTYDFLCGGRLSTAVRGAEGISLGYDGPLALTDTRSGSLSTSIGYAYNNDFVLSSLTYAGSTASIGYDNDGLLISADGYTIARNAGNGLPERLTGLGLTQTRTFNGYGELDEAASGVAGSLPYSWSVPSRDNAGRILQRQEIVGGDSITWNYVYNAVGRLMEVRKDGELVESYTYDPNGNRMTEMNTLLGIVPERSLSHTIEDHVVTAGSDSYQFDVDGFLQSRTAPEGTIYFDYSLRGELLRVDKPDGTILGYVHDPFGRRIAKQVNGTTVEKYLWKDQTTLLAVYDGSDNLLQRFVYADARTPVSMTAGGATFFLLTDQVGTLRAVADSTGTLVKRVDYDSYGNIIADTNPGFAVPFGFAGGLHDRDTGLVRFGYRDYSPELGRFVAKDPIDFAGGDTNLYAYSMSDPVNLVDPAGLSVLDWLVVPGPYGQPRSEWGPNGPTGWGNPLQYTENAGGAWKWGERAAIGAAAAGAAGAAYLGAVETAAAGGFCEVGVTVTARDAAYRAGSWLGRPYSEMLTRQLIGDGMRQTSIYGSSAAAKVYNFLTTITYGARGAGQVTLNWITRTIIHSNPFF